MLRGIIRSSTRNLLILKVNEDELQLNFESGKGLVHTPGVVVEAIALESRGKLVTSNKNIDLPMRVMASSTFGYIKTLDAKDLKECAQKIRKP